jgi:hypothetical protein
MAGVMLPAQAVNQDSLLVVDFQNRVDAYMKVRKRAQSDVPALKPTDSPEDIAEHKRHLFHKVREARPHARQGAVFTPQVSDLFRRLIAAELRGPDAAQVRASLRRAAPVPPQPLRPNASYPEGLPLQSTPPSLLLDLPRLPQGLEYRIVGRDLVLLDVDAGLIVDYLPRALPPP